MDELILVTGASGNVGCEVVKALVASGKQVRAGVVAMADAQRVPIDNADITLFDFGDPQTYAASFVGVKKLFLMRPPMISDVKRYIKPAITYAAAVGIEQIVFLSIVGVENKPFIPHYKVEKYLEASGVPYTFLRAGFFMQNLNTTHRIDIVHHNDIFVPAGSARTAFIDVRDIGAVAARVLTERGHQNKAYTLTGSEAMTYDEVAEIFSDVLRRQITYSRPSLLRFAWRMKQRGYAWGHIGVMSALYLTTQFGAAERIAADTAVLLNRPPITMHQYVQDYAPMWQVSNGVS